MFLNSKCRHKNFARELNIQSDSTFIGSDFIKVRTISLIYQLALDLNWSKMVASYTASNLPPCAFVFSRYVKINTTAKENVTEETFMVFALLPRSLLQSPTT